VLAACDGEQGLARYLDDGVEPPRPKKAAKSKQKAGKDGAATPEAAGPP